MTPVRLAEHSLRQVQDGLRDGRIAIQTGPLCIHVRSSLPDVAEALYRLYAQHPCYWDPPFADFHVEVRSPPNLRRWLRPQAVFLIEGEPTFEPLPREQAPALFEWGFNWVVAAGCSQWLNIHAACLERNGKALVLPAPPGSGKSTLCAALAFRGWRLLSDELTLLDPETYEVHGLARPINLKNDSIALIKAFAPEVVWAPKAYDTVKGRVTHAAPPPDSVAHMRSTAQPRWIVFPRYVASSEPKLQEREKALTFAHLAQNAFNYTVHGERGFRAVGGLVAQCDCYEFEYSRLEDAIEVFEWLAEESGA
ncbi:MAG: HprK-related kinase A [Betaproteobacteria bacterium]|nr:HprK-related kinase A [Betaproteobacteria bacterium]